MTQIAPRQHLSVTVVKPPLNLSAVNGNAMSLIGAAVQMARQCQWKPQQIEAFKREALSGSHSDLRRLLEQHFDVS